jgi:hypothetical protein
MIGSITPLVKAAQGSRRWSSALGAYAAGSILASIVVGGTLGILGRMIGGPWDAGRFVLASAAGVLVLHEIRVVRLPIPPIRRQTRKMWRLRFGPTRAAFLWGADLSLGFTTYVNFTSYWILAATCVLVASPMASALIMVGYGLGRILLVASGPLLVRSCPGTAIIEATEALLRADGAWHRLHAWVVCSMALILLFEWRLGH